MTSEAFLCENRDAIRLMSEFMGESFFLVNSAADIIDTNEISCKSLQYSRDELLSMKVYDIECGMTTSEVDSILTELSPGKPNFYEGVHRRADGSVFPVEIKVFTALCDNDTPIFAACVRDRSERRDVETALKNSEHRYRTLAELAPVGIFRCNAEGKTVYTSSKWHEIAEVAPEDTLGENWLEAIHPDDRLAVKQGWEDVLASKKTFHSTEYRFCRDDGSVRWILGQVKAETDTNGKILGYVGSITDVTSLRKVEEQLRHNLQEISAFDRLNLIGEMATSLAHELNQPLTAIVQYLGGCMERIQKVCSNCMSKNEIIGIMQRAINQAELAGNIIHRLKNFLRKDTTTKQSIDINRILEETLKLAEPDLREHHVAITCNLSSGLPELFVDKIQVEQVILNIIRNAMDAMEQTTLTDKLLGISTKHLSHSILISIKNSGPIIEDSHIENIFKPFYTTKSAGMGMGLAICRSIIEMQGGNIRVKSGKKKGVIFTITLPIKEEDNLND